MYKIYQLCFSKGIGGAESHVEMLKAKKLRATRRIVHTHLPKADLVGAWLQVLGWTWVCTIHSHYGEWKLRRALPIMFRLWSRADRVVAISEELRRWLIAGGVPDERITVIYYGV